MLTNVRQLSESGFTGLEDEQDAWMAGIEKVRPQI